MKSKKNSWTKSLFAYAEGEQKRLILSVLLSIFSVMLGLLPFYCMYEIICLFVAGTATKAAVIKWCLLALGIYAGKIVTFSLSTGTSHSMAYHILEGLRLRLADRFCMLRLVMYRIAASAKSKIWWWIKLKIWSRRLRI